MRATAEKLIAQKKTGELITMITAYDYPSAQLEDEAGVDVILVGDSVGTNVLGYGSELEVTMADMIHHCKAVARAVKNAYLIVDMPFGSATDPLHARENAEILIQNGADCVKIEGWTEIKPIVELLTGKGIPVCGHIGYNPQKHGSRARIFGKDAQQAAALIESSRVIEAAGAIMIIVEKIPEEVASIIASERTIPVIGIGSGKCCDGQVLVMHDILGFGTRTYKHARKYMDFRCSALESFSAYCDDVRKRKFPSEENLFHMGELEFKKLS